MTTTLEKRWTDLKVELAKLEAEAQVRGAAARDSIARVVASVEARAAEARDKASLAAEAGSERARESRQQLENSFHSAQAAVEDAWRELRK